ncbi:putative FUN34-transmembrane protein [Rhizophagus clarus]|uniref:Putative FUN34-transmembrane protein n=1 Tax=Rhizophagus clarus TaxID=94130 RepID=A0A8H3LCT1_9GLOM|nr:putative FUN34-transmembrane protein [Rhizophagus clarus]
MPDTQIYIQDYMRSDKSRPHSTSAKRHKPKIGNPTPLGLSAFALSVMVSALYNLKLFGITQSNVMIGVSLFTGGVVQFASGMWEFKVGNTFGGTGFSAFGGFWASYGTILHYFADNVDSDQYHNTMGTFCSAWLMFTFIFTLACIRTNLVNIFIKLAGVSGMLTCTAVWYCLGATLLTPDLSPISLPLYDLSHKD